MTVEPDDLRRLLYHAYFDARRRPHNPRLLCWYMHPSWHAEIQRLIDVPQYRRLARQTGGGDLLMGFPLQVNAAHGRPWLGDRDPCEWWPQPCYHRGQR